MYEKINLLKCMSAILFLFILGLAWISAAGDCGDCEEPPTFPGNASRCECTAPPTIVPTFAEGMDTIDSSHPVTLSASGGCPPYTWSTDSIGYTLAYNEDGTATLSVTNGTCIKNMSGNYDVVATVTVADCCSPSKIDTIEVRHDVGNWVRCSSWSQSCTVGCFCEGDPTTGYLIIGKHRIYHAACYRGYGSCGDNPYEADETCSADGWVYTFNSTNCPVGCKTCDENKPIAIWRRYIDYWGCP